MVIRGFFCVIVGTIALTTVGEAALPLPSFIKPCSKNDPKLNECVLSHGNPVIPLLKNGLPKYGIPVLEPMKIETLNVDQGSNPESNIGFKLLMRDLLIHGLSDIRMKSARIELDPPHFWIDYQTPKLTILGKYNIDGKVLILPIKGDGDVNITLVNLNFQHEIYGDLVKESDGNEYLTIKRTGIDHTSDRNYMKFTNLFNGDETLGKHTNDFLDANWREVSKEVGVPIAEAVSEVTKIIIEAFTSQVPFNKIFPEKV